MDREHELSVSKMASNAKPPVLVASTGDTYCGSIAEYKFRQQNKLAPGGSESGLAEPTARTEDAEWNYFKSAQWQVIQPLSVQPPAPAQDSYLTNLQVARRHKPSHFQR